MKTFCPWVAFLQLKEFLDGYEILFILVHWSQFTQSINSLFTIFGENLSVVNTHMYDLLANSFQPGIHVLNISSSLRAIDERDSKMTIDAILIC